MADIKIAFDPAKLRLVDPKTLKVDPKNRNKHSDAQIDRFCKLLKEYGMRWPILVSERTGVIKAGEGRLLAALKLQMPKVLVSYQEFTSEQQEFGFAISDNAISAWSELDLSGIQTDLKDFPDMGIELLGIEDFEIVDAEKLPPGCDEDEVPEAKETICKLGDIWTLGNHRLMCGDSTSIDAVEKLMHGKKADMVFTDPPYGVAVKNTQGGILGDEDLTVFRDCLPVLKAYADENAHFYVWCAAGDRLPESINLFSQCIPFQNLLPVRCTHENKRGKKGAFKLNYEVCLFGNNNAVGFNASKKFKVSETTLGDERYKGDGFLRVYPALWDGERATEHNMNIVHPTQKKVEMIEFYIEISSGESSLVLDLFGGSGSTLIACEKTDRKCFMMELDPHYCDVIIARFERYSGKKAVLQSN